MGASSQRALEEEQADERLRDAAPKMLGALKFILDDPNTKLSQWSLVAIRSAIRSATGKKP